MIPTEDIQQKVRSIVAKCLMIEEDEVQLHSKLIDELDAESIDILDIRFALEQHFGFKTNNEEIRAILKKFADDRALTEKDIQSRFTIQSLCDYVVHKLQSQ